MDKNFWEDAEVIFSYSRAQAIADGVLVDVTETAKEAGFRDHTVITQALYERLQCSELEKAEGQSFEGRLWDVLFVGITKARAYIRKNNPKSPFRLDITISIREEANGKIKANLMDYQVDFGLGDNGELVITIGFWSDF